MIQWALNREKIIYQIAIAVSDVLVVTVEFVDHGIANATSPYTGSFTYTKATWLVLAGRLVDALVYDLSHGGNIRTRALTTAIHADASITGKTTEFNAMVARILVVIDAVLSNEFLKYNYNMYYCLLSYKLYINKS